MAWLSLEEPAEVQTTYLNSAFKRTQNFHGDVEQHDCKISTLCRFSKWKLNVQMYFCKKKKKSISVKNIRNIFLLFRKIKKNILMSDLRENPFTKIFFKHIDKFCEFRTVLNLLHLGFNSHYICWLSNKTCETGSFSLCCSYFHSLDSLGSSEVEDNAAVPSPRWQLFQMIKMFITAVVWK